jgi:virginiamycin B lyase
VHTNDVYGITSGADGALWFTQPLSRRIGRITTAGEIATYPIALGSPGAITVGPRGDLWFTAIEPSVVAHVTTTGAMQEYRLGGLDKPGGITSGPDHAVWFTVYTDDKIGRAGPTQS